MIEERKYQTLDLERIEKSLGNGKSVLYQLPTGGGKTVVTCSVIAKRKESNILILAHKKKLITQMRDQLVNRSVSVGILQGSNSINTDRNILIASIQTASRDHTLERLIDRPWDYVVIDEARRSRTASYDKLLSEFKLHNPGLQIIGLDATPHRRDKRRLDYHFDEMIVSSENTFSLMQKGYLADTITYATPIGKIEEEVTDWGGDFQVSQLSSYMRKSEYMKHVLQSWFQYSEQKQTIVFAVDKQHAADLLELFQDNGINTAAMITSDNTSEEIDTAYELYEKGEIKVLINVEMITDGVDLPDTGCLLIARPTQSLTLYLQILGRGLRPKQDKSKLIVIDCAGVTDKFGGIRTKHHWSLNPEVDPNGGRKTKVFGKGPQGELIEDLSDYIGEVIELSPEEYILQLESSEEIAIITNNRIDNSVEQLCKKIDEVWYGVLNKSYSDLFIKTDYKSIIENRNGEVNSIEIAIGNKTDKQTQDVVANINNQKNYRSMHGFFDNGSGFGHITIQVKYQKRIVAHSASFSRFLLYSQQPSDELDNYMYFSSIVGYLNDQIQTNKSISSKIFEITEEITSLISDKINLQDFTTAKKAIEEKKWKEAIDLNITQQNWFEFDISTRTPYVVVDRGLRSSEFFRECEHTYIKRILIDKSLTKHQNTIYINDKDEFSAKKYIKEEKVLEILEKGKWHK
jgi:DNA repair protein RadD